MSDTLALAYQAKTELPATQKAIETLVQALKDRWADSDDLLTREALWNRLRALREVGAILVAAATEADLASYVETLKAEGF